MWRDARFRELIEAASAPIWLSDAAGECTYVNDAWLRFTGRTAGQELGAGWIEGIHPEDRELRMAAYRRAIAARVPFTVEYRLRHHDGVHRWVSESGSPVGEGADFRGIVGVCTDVHDRHTERERHGFQAALFEALDGAVGTTDRLSVLADRVADRFRAVCVVEAEATDGLRRRVAVGTRERASVRLAEALRMPPECGSAPGAGYAGPAGVLLDAPEPGDLAGAVPWALDAAAWRTIAAGAPRAVAAVRLVARGRTIGSLVALTTGRRRMHSPDVAFLEDLALRAALALDNARLFHEAQESARRVGRLQAATAALSAAATPAQVAHVAVDEARRVLGAMGATLFEVRGRELVALARGGWPAAARAWAHLPLHLSTPVTDAVRSRDPVWIDGPGDWRHRYPGVIEDVGRRNLEVAAALPLVTANEVVGAMALGFPPGHRLADADRDAARVFGEACGQALARARLQREAVAERTWAELRAEVAPTLDGPEPEDERLARFARRLVPRVADVARITIGRPDAGGGALTVTARIDSAQRVDVEHRPAGNRTDLDAAALRVLSTGRSEVGVDAHAGPAAAGVLTAVSVPIGARGDVFGVLTLRTTTRSGRRLSDAELAKTEELGRRAGLALDGARRAEGERRARASAERARGRTERLQRVTAALSACLTEQAVAEVVLHEGMDALGAVGGAVAVERAGEAAVVLHAGHAPGVAPAGAAAEAAGAGPLARVMRSGGDVWPEDACADDEAPAAGLPLRLGTRPVGALVFWFPPGGRPLAEGDRGLARAMAAQCALALERARLFEAEHRTAEVLQRALLPQRLPQPRGAHMDVRYVGAAGERSGGDFYDAVDLPGGALSFVVGDVVGHGAEAAAVMGQLRSAWRMLALEGTPPGELLERLGRFAARLPGAAVSTVACGMLEGGLLRHACAGHPPPLVRRPDGGTEYLREGRGPPLAVGDLRYPEGSLRLPPGSLLLLYTDGVIERDRDVDRGMAELAELVGQGEVALAGLLDRLGEVIGPAPHDDCALLAIQVAGAVEMRCGIPADPAALRDVRAAAGGWLADRGIPADRVADMVVAIDEALSNCVEHAYAATLPPRDDAVVLHMGVDPAHTLTVTVGDRGAWRQPAAEPGLRGRGLALMRAIMDRVEVTATPEGTTVRMTAALDGAAQAPRPPARPVPIALGAGDGRGAPLDPGPEIDLASIPGLRARLRAASTGADGGPLVVDLSRLRHIGSAGVRFLVEVADDLRGGGGFAVVAPPGTVARRVLDLAGVADAVAVVDGDGLPAGAA